MNTRQFTGSELAAEICLSLDALKKAVNRTGGQWTTKGQLSPETVSAVLDYYADINPLAYVLRNDMESAKKRANFVVPALSPVVPEIQTAVLNELQSVPDMSAPVTEQTTPVPATHRKTRTLPAVGVEHLLALIVVGHSVLVGCELYTLLAWPGLFAALVVFGLKTSAVVLSLDSRYEKFAADAVGVCLLLDILAVFLHRYTFFFSISALTTQRLGYEVVEYMCIALSLVVSGGSFAALFLIKKTANLQSCSAS